MTFCLANKDIAFSNVEPLFCWLSSSNQKNEQRQPVYFEATMAYFAAVRAHTFSHIDFATPSDHFHFLLTNQKKKALKIRIQYRHKSSPAFSASLKVEWYYLWMK